MSKKITQERFTELFKIEFHSIAMEYLNEGYFNRLEDNVKDFVIKNCFSEKIENDVSKFELVVNTIADSKKTVTCEVNLKDYENVFSGQQMRTKVLESSLREVFETTVPSFDNCSIRFSFGGIVLNVEFDILDYYEKYINGIDVNVTNLELFDYGYIREKITDHIERNCESFKYIVNNELKYHYGKLLSN